MQVWVRGAATLAAVMFALVAPAQAAAPKVAVIVSLSGPLAAIGREIEQTSRAWAQMLNARAGAAGPVVDLLVLDDKSGAEGASEAARQALAQGAALVMNCFGSVACTAIAKELKPTGLPLVGAIAGDENLRGPDYPHVFTTRGGARDELGIILKYMQGLDMSRVVVLVQDDGFGQSYRKTLDALLEGRTTLRAVTTVLLDPAQKNYAQAAAKAVAEPSNAVILLANTVNSLGLIDAMNEAGYRGLYFNLAAQANPVFVSHIGKLTAGHKLVAAFVTTTPHPMQAQPGVAAYRDAIARGAPNLVPSYIGLEVFTNATLAGQVLQRDTRPTAEATARLLQSFNGNNVGGMTVRFDPLRRQAVRWLDLSVVTRDGQVRSY